MGSQFNIIDVNETNINEVGIYCIKNLKANGFKAKAGWFNQDSNQTLKIKIATDENDRQLGFIEYTDSEHAWRPLRASNFLFIHCITIMKKDDRQKGIASALIEACELDAREQEKDGVCVMTSSGVWLADKSLFEKNGFSETDRKDRFELMTKTFGSVSEKPAFMDWNAELSKYQGWHLLYADQCPWHDKSATDLLKTAEEMKIDLNVKKLSSPKEAQKSPAGFGVFALIKDGKLVADHYISKTRFKNILKKEI